jgi:hypothetical protein
VFFLYLLMRFVHSGLNVGKAGAANFQEGQAITLRLALMYATGGDVQFNVNNT